MNIFVRALFVLFMVIIFQNVSYADSRLDNCLQYQEQIVALLESEGLSSDYFYLAVCESGCKDIESHKGAVGFFQVTRPIYKHYKDDSCGDADISDIRCNTIAAARYLKHLKERFKDFHTLIKAYNRGGTNFQRKGSTAEANGLARCVLQYVNSSDI